MFKINKLELKCYSVTVFSLYIIIYINIIVNKKRVGEKEVNE